MEEMSEAVPPREAWGTMPVANFAKLTVSAGMLEWQEVSTLPVLPPVQEQAGPQDVEMAVTGPDMAVLEEEEVELTFGEPPWKLTPAEEAKYQRYQDEWDAQDQVECQQLEKLAHANKVYNAKAQAQRDADKQKWEKEKEQEWDLREQCDQLLAQQAAKEMTNQTDYQHEQAQEAKECKAAELREKDRIAQEHLDQWNKDQEELK